MDMAGRYGEPRLRLQGDVGADALAKQFEPLGLSLEPGDDNRRRRHGQAAMASISFRAAEKSPRRRADRVVAKHFRYRGPFAPADDLEEAEAVDGGAFERLRQKIVERGGRGLA